MIAANFIDFPHVSMAALVSRTLISLLLAAVLGGIIGLERELKRKPAGLRTNMFICFGSAFFTVLSIEIAISHPGSDATRIAAQIIPGIGFIGAGSILHSKGNVTGVTTAATIFVVASIGMACGGGLYLPAIFATLLILLALHLLGWMERVMNLKPLMMNYSLTTGRSADDILAEVNTILEERGKRMGGMRLSHTNGKERIMFTVDGTRTEHRDLMDRLRRSPDLHNFEATADLDSE